MSNIHLPLGSQRNLLNFHKITVRSASVRIITDITVSDKMRKSQHPLFTYVFGQISIYSVKFEKQSCHLFGKELPTLLAICSF